MRSYITGAMWPVPLLAILVYQLFHTAIYALNAWLVRIGLLDEQTAFFALSSAGARSLLETAISANLSFLVFTFGSLLVAIQVAGGQYTPRIIATTLLRDNVIRFTVGLFVFTLVFALRVLTRMDETVPQLDTFVAAILGMVSIMVFLFLIDYAARLLRPVSLAARVGRDGHRRHRGDLSGGRRCDRAPATPSRDLGSPARTVTHAGAAGVVLAVGPGRAGGAGPARQRRHRVRAAGG